MGKADLHIHTRVSDGMATVEAVLAYVQEKTDLDLIAVTDHEDVTGGLRARELAAQRGYRFEVTPGAEVTTMQGHLIAIGIEVTPKSFRRVESTLEMIHSQGGVAIVPHPMSWLTRSLSERTIARICARAEAGVTFDAIETANPSPAGKLRRQQAIHRNRTEWRLAETGGSDAHHLVHIGTGWTEFEGQGSAGLRTAIEGRTTRGVMRPYPSLREVGYGQAAMGLAWGYAATPRKVAADVARRWGRGR
ncbi:MAG TPA: PHP-associated domain-containing protein [Tepidiformaceae bacterium]|nr:PHP-associated domain-containing protein [Tepidiformaceae bacterium]